MNGFATAQARHDNAEPPEPTEGSSLQKLGDAPVLVCFDGYPDALEIVGVVIDGHEVPADCFSADTLAGWCDAIRAELARDAAIALDCAPLAATYASPAQVLCWVAQQDANSEALAAFLADRPMSWLQGVRL